MNEMTFVVLVFICEWLYAWSILLEEDEDADSSTTDMHDRDGSGKKLRCDSGTDDERRYSTLIVERVISSRKWKSGFLTGYCIYRKNSWKWQIHKAIILGDWALMYRMVEEFRSLKDAVAGLQLMQTMWLESIFHANSE